MKVVRFQISVCSGRLIIPEQASYRFVGLPEPGYSEVSDTPISKDYLGQSSNAARDLAGINGDPMEID